MGSATLEPLPSSRLSSFDSYLLVCSSMWVIGFLTFPPGFQFLPAGSVLRALPGTSTIHHRLDCSHVKVDIYKFLSFINVRFTGAVVGEEHVRLGDN